MVATEINMDKHHKINYVEFSVTDMAKAKSFYAKVFGWTFVDYGPEYSSIDNASLDAGFFLSTEKMPAGALIVLYSNQLEQTQKAIEEHGGKITKPIFEFPGGRRFHFHDVCENEFAVWSDLKS